MSLPAGVTTATLTIGRPFDAFGNYGTLKVSITPVFGGTAQRLVWTATGETFEAFTLDVGSDPDGDATETFSLPHVNQSGWVDGSGNAITMWAYKIDVTPTMGSGSKKARMPRYTKWAQPLVGQTTIDIDTLVDGTAAAPTLGASTFVRNADLSDGTSPARVTLDALYASSGGGGAIHVYATGSHGIGSGDDTAWLQAKLDQVSVALGLDTVVIHDGTWMIDAVNESQSTHKNRWIGGGLQPKTGTTLILTPGAILKVIPNTSPGYACVYLGRGQDNIAIRGGQLLGDRATHDFTTDTSDATHEYGYGIATRGAKDILIQGVRMSGFTGDGIFVSHEGLRTLNPYYPSTRITVRSCTIDGSRRNNISVVGCDTVLIENCTITNAGTNDGTHDGTPPRYGIDIEAYGDAGIDYAQCLNVTIRGNTFTGNLNGAAVNFNGYGVVIDGNFADSPLGFGAGTETVITNNVVKNTADTTNFGIMSLSGISYDANSIVRGNVVEGFLSGIQIQRTAALVSENYITGFQDTGILVTSAAEVTVSNNHVTDGLGTAAKGIWFVSSTTCSAKGNKIHNIRTAIRLTTSSTGVTAENNTITKGFQALNVAAGCQMVFRGNMTELPGHADGQTYDATWATTAQVLCEGNVFRNSSTFSVSASNSTGGKSRIIRNAIVDSTSTSGCLSLSGGKHEVVGNTLITAATSGTPVAVTIAGAADKSMVMGNIAYNSGTTAFAYLVNSTAATNTRVVGNTVSASTAVTNGAGSEVAADNNLVTP